MVVELLKEEIIFQESGEVSEQVGAIIILIMGVSVATIMIIFSGVLSGQVYTETAPDLATLGGDISNEALGTANASGNLNATLAHTDRAVVSAINCGTTATTNYTATSGHIIVRGADCINDSVTANYAYGDSTSAGYVTTAIQSGFKGLKVTGTYLPIVVLAVIIFIVLGLVMSLAKPTSSGSGVL